MGNQLSTIPPDRFRDQIFSIVLYYISSKANPNLKFVPREKCTDDNLPIPEHPDLSQILNLYNINDDLVINYVKKNILNSEENLIRFYQTLIQLLQDTNSKVDPPTAYKPENTPRQTDRLTRSQLNKIKSRNPSIASTYRAKKEEEIRRQKMRDQERNQQPERSTKPSRTESERPVARLEDSSRSSHFTPSKIVNRPDEVQPIKFPGNSDIPDESFEKVRQNLVVNLLSRDEPGYHQEIEQQEEESSEDFEVPAKTREVKESDDQSEVKSDPPVKLPTEHQIEQELKDDHTLKHRHRFKDQCIIQENFD